MRKKENILSERNIINSTNKTIYLINLQNTEQTLIINSMPYMNNKENKIED